MFFIFIMSVTWLHNVTHYPDPPDAEYVALVQDFVDEDAYLRYLEKS